MNIESLAQILAALMVLHAFHVIGEMTNVRYKALKLKATINSTHLPEKSFNVDTSAKLVAVQVLMILVPFSRLFFNDQLASTPNHDTFRFFYRAACVDNSCYQHRLRPISQ